MNPQVIDTMAFARFYVNAVFNGADLQLMKQRYPEWDFEVSDGNFVLRRKAPVVAKEFEHTNAPTTKQTELQGAAAAAAAATAVPLQPVE